MEGTVSGPFRDVVYLFHRSLFAAWAPQYVDTSLCHHYCLDGLILHHGNIGGQVHQQAAQANVLFLATVR
ncbi:uncharacterized protein Dvar_64670 [Desulfosarcina variabilis str. Montpellier]